MIITTNAIRQRRWYYRNQGKKKRQVKQRYREMRKWFYELKSSLKCARCGFNDPRALDFHHKDPSDKDFSVGRGMVNTRWGKERMLKEIEKCEVLCANCHRIEHAPIVEQTRRLSSKQEALVQIRLGVPKN